MQRHRREWPISVQCRVLEVSVAGYHEHFVRRASTSQRRHLSDDALLVHIKAIHAETRGGYDWSRTWKELLARGIRVGKGRVQKLMQLNGIRAKGKRRFKVTTDAIMTFRSRQTCSSGSSPWKSPTRSGRAISCPSQPTKVGCSWPW